MVGGAHYHWFHRFTALLNCASRTTKSNSNELPISVPLSLWTSRPCNYCLPDCSIFQKSVTAPRDAEETMWAYLPRTPRLYSGGKVVSFRFAQFFVWNVHGDFFGILINCHQIPSVEGRRLGHQPELQAQCDRQRDHKYHLRSGRLSGEPPCLLVLSQQSWMIRTAFPAYQDHP